MNLRRLIFPSLFLLVAIFGWMNIQPGHRPAYQPGLDRLAQIEFDGDQVTIGNLRNFQWKSLDEVDPIYETRSYDLSTVESLWLCLSIFNPDGWQGPAHTLLSFGFSNGEYLAVSVEARKEPGEGYSIYRGMAKRYELMYVLGDESDLIANRAALRPDAVYLYPIRAEKTAVAEILRSILEGAERIPDHPEFYHTLFNNCTTRLADHVNAVAPGTIPHSWKVVLPGYSDELLASLGLLSSVLPPEQLRAAYDIKSSATRAHGAEDFSHRIREGLPGGAP